MYIYEEGQGTPEAYTSLMGGIYIEGDISKIAEFARNVLSVMTTSLQKNAPDYKERTIDFYKGYDLY